MAKKRSSKSRSMPKSYIDPETGKKKDIEEHPEYRYKFQDDPKYKGADKETQDWLKANRTKFDDPLDLAKGLRALKAAIKFAQKHGWNTSAGSAAKNTRDKKENIDRAANRAKNIGIDWSKGQWSYKDPKTGDVNSWKMPIFGKAKYSGKVLKDESEYADDIKPKKRGR